MSDARLEAWLTFIAAIAGAVAWPILLGIVFLTIREPLARLIGRVSMVSWSEGRAEFGAALQKGVDAAAAVAAAESTEAVEADSNDFPDDQPGKPVRVEDPLTRQLEERLAAGWPPELLQVQIVSPRAKEILKVGGPLPWDRVRNSWLAFDNAMIRIVEIKLGQRPRNAVDATARLLKARLIDHPVAELIFDVQGLWDLAAQPETSVPPKEAESFQLLAAKVIQMVLNKTSGPDV